MFLKKQYALPSLCTHSVIKPCQFFVRPPSLVALAAQLCAVLLQKTSGAVLHVARKNFIDRPAQW